MNTIIEPRRSLVFHDQFLDVPPQSEDLDTYPSYDQHRDPAMTFFESDMDWTTPPLSPSLYSPPTPSMLSPIPGTHTKSPVSWGVAALGTEADLQTRALDVRSMYLHGPREGYEPEQVRLVHFGDENNKHTYYIAQAEAEFVNLSIPPSQDHVPIYWNGAELSLANEVDELTTALDNVDLSGAEEESAVHADDQEVYSAIERTEGFPLHDLTASFFHLSVHGCMTT